MAGYRKTTDVTTGKGLMGKGGQREALAMTEVMNSLAVLLCN